MNIFTIGFFDVYFKAFIALNIYSQIDGMYLFTNTSKQKHAVDEMYYSLDEILTTHGKLVYDKKHHLILLRTRLIFNI